MKVRSKAYKENMKLIDSKKAYSVDEAIALALKTNHVKFDAAVEAAFYLNLDPRHADQQLRGSLILPEGSGQSQKILVLTKMQHSEAEKAGADFVGATDYIEKIKKNNWFGFDVIVATPEIMGELGKIGRILGPKGLMPNPKLGTVTQDVTKVIAQIRKGKVTYKTDKFGNVHIILGKASFSQDKIKNNFKEVFDTIVRSKPATVKGKYIKNISISTSMGPGIKVLPET